MATKVETVFCDFAKLPGDTGNPYIIKQQAFGGGACVCHGHFILWNILWNMPKHAQTNHHQMSLP
jgi:hypothetical protein